MYFKDLSFIWALTCFFSFCVQFFVYLFYLSHDHPIIKKHKSVLHYTSGIAGDGVLIPFVSVFAASVLNSLQWWPINFWQTILASLMGIGITFIFHWGQEHYKLTNWTMPENGQWNKLGLYHAIFMFGESSFLSFALIEFIKSLVIHQTNNLQPQSFYLAWVILGIFFITFVYDYWSLLFKKLIPPKLLSK